jgi:membrane-bound lytic murein transglycosylase B
MGSMNLEYGVFRKDGRDGNRPIEGRTFDSAASAARYMQAFINWQDWLEVHEREVSPWKVSV